MGGRARYLFRPRDAEQLARLVVRARDEGAPVKVLGCGANVLISDDGVDGVVVRLDQPAFRGVRQKGGRIETGAGVDLIPFARRCCLQGLSGLECMAGIPATIGGALRMNAGGPRGEFGQVVQEVHVLRPDGQTEIWPHDRLGFGYRHTDLDDRIVLSVRLELKEDDPRRVRERFEDNFAQKERTQPLGEHSAGCVFKNPPGKSAGALIDQSGLKGMRCGGAVVSEKHANFIVAREGATASDVLRLIDLVRDRVRQTFGTELEIEIEVWRPTGAGGVV